MTTTQDTQMTLDHRFIPVGDIKPNPDNVRESIGDLTDLVDSIKTHGVLEPIVVFEITPKPSKGPAHMVVFGHRRLAAAKKAKLKDVPALVRAQPDEATLTEIMLAENLHRSDLDPIEEAMAVKRIHELDPNRTHQQIASGINRSAQWVADRLAIALGIPQQLQKRVRTGELSIGDAVLLGKSKLSDAKKIKLGTEDVGGYDGARRRQIESELSKERFAVVKKKAIERLGKANVVSGRPSPPLGAARLVGKETDTVGRLNIPDNLHAASCEGHRLHLQHDQWDTELRTKGRAYCVTPWVHPVKEFTGKPKKPGEGEIAVHQMVKDHPDWRAEGSLKIEGVDSWDIGRVHRGCPHRATVVVPWEKGFGYGGGMNVCLQPSVHVVRSGDFIPVEQLKADAFGKPAEPAVRNLELAPESMDVLDQVVGTWLETMPREVVAFVVLGILELWDDGDEAELADALIVQRHVLRLINEVVEGYRVSEREMIVFDALFLDAGAPLSDALPAEELARAEAARARIPKPTVNVPGPDSIEPPSAELPDDPEFDVDEADAEPESLDA